MKKVVNTKRKDTIFRFKEAVASRLMLGEPRMVGFFLGNYFQFQHLFGEKAFCKWDFLIHIEAVGFFKKKKNIKDGNNEKDINFENNEKCTKDLNTENNENEIRDNEESTELCYKIMRGYWNPIMIFMWFSAFFVPFFMVVAANSLWDMFPPVLLFGLPAIPIATRVIVTFICSRVCKKADEGIKLLEEEIDYEISRINKYPKIDVREK